MGNNYYDNQNAQAPNVALVHTIAGEPVNGGMGVPSGGDIQLASRYSTAPYKPGHRLDKATKKALCGHKDCKNPPAKATDPYCYGHGIKMGLVPHPRSGKKGQWPSVEEATDGDTD